MFRVDWVEAALDDLARVWTTADSEARRSINAAVTAPDQQLAADPFLSSESRDGDERVIFVFPLGALVEVDLSRRVVWVLHVWRVRRRGG